MATPPDPQTVPEKDLPLEDEFIATLPEVPAEILAANALYEALEEEDKKNLGDAVFMPTGGGVLTEEDLPENMGPRLERKQKIKTLNYIDRAKKTAMSQYPDIPESAFTQAWNTAYTRVNKGVYKTQRDVLDNYKADSTLDIDAFNAVSEDAKTVKPLFIAVGFNTQTGKAVSVPVTGTDFDKRLADRLPEGPEKTLLLANLNPDDWQGITSGLLDTEQNRNRLELAPTDQDIRSLYTPGPDVEKTGLPFVIVPLFEDPTQGRGYRAKNSISLKDVREVAETNSLMQITGGRDILQVRRDAIQAFNDGNRELGVPLEGYTDAEAYGDAVQKYVRTEQRRSGQEEINHLRAQLEGTYLYSKTSDSIEDYLEGDIYGGIGRVPVAREIGALTLPTRAIAGTIEGPEEFKKNLAEEGGLEFLAEGLGGVEISEYGATRALDDMIRIAPSTVMAAAEWQAYKEWLALNQARGRKDKDGKLILDPKEGRREFILQKIFEISHDPDRMTMAIASSYDPAGNMLMKAGRLTYPDLHENFPVLANTLAGAPRLFWMLIEPDALQATAAATGGVAGFAAGKTASLIGKGAKTYKTIRRGAALVDDAIQAAKTADELEAAVEAAVKSDVSGAAGIAQQIIARQAAFNANAKGAKEVAKVVAGEQEALRQAENAFEYASKVLDEEIDAAKGAQTAAEQKIKSTKVVKASLEKRAAEVDKLSAELDVRKTQIDLAVREAAVNKQMEQLSTPTTAAPKKPKAKPKAKTQTPTTLADLGMTVDEFEALSPLEKAATAKKLGLDLEQPKTLKDLGLTADEYNALPYQEQSKILGQLDETSAARQLRLEFEAQAYPQNRLSAEARLISEKPKVKKKPADGTPRTKKEKADRFEDLEARNRELVSLQKSLDDIEAGDLSPAQKRQASADVRERIKTILVKTSEEADARATSPRIQQMLADQAETVEKLRKTVGEAGWKADSAALGRIVSAAADGGKGYDDLVELAVEQVAKAEKAYGEATDKVAEIEKQLELTERAHEKLANTPSTEKIPGLWNNQQNSLEEVKRVSRMFRSAAEVAASKEGQAFINSRFYTPEGTTTLKVMEDAPEEVASITDKYFEVQNRLAAGESKMKVIAQTGGEGSKRLVLSFLGYAAIGQETLRGYENIGNTITRLRNKHGVLWTRFASPKFYSDALYIGQAQLIAAADAIDRSGIATTRVGVLGSKFAEAYQEAANANSREIKKWFSDTDAILAHFSGQVVEDAGKATSVAKARAVEYIGTQNRIELGGTRSNIEVSGNQIGGSATDNILNLAIDNWASIGRTFVRTKGDDLTEHFLEKSNSLQGFVLAHVGDNIGQRGQKKAKDAIVAFGRWLNRTPEGQTLSNAERIKLIPDPSKRMSELSKGVMSEIDRINLNSIKEARIPKVVGKDTDPFLMPGRSFRLVFKNVITGAMERGFVKDVSNLTSGNLGIRNLRALELMISGADESSLYKTTLPLRETIEVGDRVALRSDIDPLRKILTRKPSDTKGKGKRVKFDDLDAKRRGPEPFTSVLESDIAAPKTYEVGKVSETGIVTLIDNAGDTTTVPLKNLTRMGGEFASYDLVDGYMAYGLDLARNVGVVKDTDFIQRWNGLRDNYVRFILHSYDENGNPNIIPKIDWGAFSYETKNLMKDLNVTLSSAKAGNHLVEQSTRVPSRLVNWWKNKTLFGITGVKAFRFFFGNADGDFEKIAIELGYSKALQIKSIGLLGYVPIVGPAFQDGTRRMIAAGTEALGGLGVPGPSILSGNMSEFLDDVLEGVNETRTYYKANGDPIELNPRDFKRDATRAGVFEDILRTEGSDSLRVAADREFRENPAGTRSIVKETKQAGEAFVSPYARWLAIFRDANAVGTHRTKMLVFSDLIVNQGMSVSEATKAMNRTIFDYTLSVSPLEAATIAKYATFYTYSKNQTLTTAADVMSVSSKTRRWFMNKLVIGRRYKRARALYRMTQIQNRRSDVDISDIDQGVGSDDFSDIEGVLDKKLETRENIFRPYDYLLDSMIVQKGALPLEVQEDLRDTGSLATSYVLTSGAPLGVLQTLNTFAEIQKMSIAGVASLFFSDLGFDGLKSMKASTEAFLQQLYPAQEAILNDFVRKLVDIGPGYSADYKKISQRAYENIEYFGLEDNLDIEVINGQYVTRNPLAVSGIFDPMTYLGDEPNFIRLLATTVMGDIGEAVPDEVRVQMKVYLPQFPLRIPDLDPLIDELSGGKIKKFEFNKYEDLGPLGIRLAAAEMFTREMKIHMFNSTKNISATVQSVKRFHDKRMRLLRGKSDRLETLEQEKRAEEE